MFAHAHREIREKRVDIEKVASRCSDLTSAMKIGKTAIGQTRRKAAARKRVSRRNDGEPVSSRRAWQTSVGGL
jgi:hypothetical protein